jgi:hypothetical protein
MKSKTIFAILSLMVLFFVTVASAQYAITQYISGRLVIQNGATVQLRASSAVYTYGASSINMGDSSYLSLGGRIADTTSFGAGVRRIAVYIPGATVNDIYFVTPRAVFATPTSEIAPDSTPVAVYAKTDSAILLRTGTKGSTLYVNWMRVKLQ